MDGITLFIGIVVVAVTAMVIYMFVDMQNYKKDTAQELAQNDKDMDLAKKEVVNKVNVESQERERNVNYIIDKTNEANANLYNTMDKNMNDIQTNLNNLNNASQAMSSVMRVTGGSGGGSGGSQVLGSTGTGTSQNGRSVTELPGSGSPNLELLSTVMATNGMTVKNTTTTDKLQLGDKFLMSGVGDAHANDDWLRLFGKDGKNYYGGLAAGKLWAGKNAYLMGSTESHGNLNIRGGTSEHNPNGWWTHFPWAGDNKNYIRGDTEIRGNTNNIGDLNVGRNANVQGRLHFSDPSMSKGFNPANSSDSYYLEKKVVSPNASHLRLTLKDDNDESMQIWGGSCAAGKCEGDGTMKHKFDAMGNAQHAGMLKVNRTDADKYPNGWGAGVHTWDLYANGTIAAGTDGKFNSWMTRDGHVLSGNNGDWKSLLAPWGGQVNRDPKGKVTSWNTHGQIGVGTENWKPNAWMNADGHIGSGKNGEWYSLMTPYGNVYTRNPKDGTVNAAMTNDGHLVAGRNWQWKFVANPDGHVWHDGTVHSKGDHVFHGGNNWIIHTPDDGRTSMFIAPSSAYNKLDWNWGKSVALHNNGDLQLNGGRVCIQDVCLTKDELSRIKSNLPK